MKLHPVYRKGERASILVVCMVLAGVGTIGAAAFFSLIHAKSQESLVRETAVTRRNAQANSRALAKDELLHRAAASGDDDSTRESVLTLPDGWGGFGLGDNTGTGGSPLTYTGGFRFHKTGALPFQTYSRDLGGTLRVDGKKTSLQFQAKSIHPALSGDLLIVEPQTVSGSPAIQFSGNLDIKGRAVFWNSNYAAATATLRADRVILANSSLPNLGLVNTAGEAILPDNTPLPPSTAGFVNGAPRFDGASHLVKNPSTTGNDYSDYVQANAGLSVAGGVPTVKSTSLATYPAGPNDTVLLAEIALLPPGLPTTLPTSLADQVPLSSAVLSALIARNLNADDELVLLTLLAMNGALPDDVLIQLLDGTANMSSENVWNVIRANPVFFAMDGAGTAFLDLDSSAATHVEITDNVSNVILRGQADAASQANAALLPPLVVVIHEESNAGPNFLTAISFEEENHRPFILAARKRGNTAAVTGTFTAASAFPEWRAILELDNVEMQFDTAAVSAATITGGIRTNRSINVTSGTVTLDREVDATSLTVLRGAAARSAWIETYSLIP